MIYRLVAGLILAVAFNFAYHSFGAALAFAGLAFLVGAHHEGLANKINDLGERMPK